MAFRNVKTLLLTKQNICYFNHSLCHVSCNVLTHSIVPAATPGVVLPIADCHKGLWILTSVIHVNSCTDSGHNIVSKYVSAVHAQLTSDLWEPNFSLFLSSLLSPKSRVQFWIHTSYLMTFIMWKLLYEYGYYPIVHLSAKARGVALVHVCIYIVTTRPFILFAGQPPHLPFRRFLNSYGLVQVQNLSSWISRAYRRLLASSYFFFAWPEYEATATCKLYMLALDT